MVTDNGMRHHESVPPKSRCHIPNARSLGTTVSRDDVQKMHIWLPEIKFKHGMFGVAKQGRSLQQHLPCGRTTGRAG